MGTPKQRELYDYLCRYIDAKKYAPTIAEIGTHLKLSSPASVHYLLGCLQRDGLITRIPNVSRGIEIVKQEKTPQAAEIPVLGIISAGQPIEAILTNERITIPMDWI